jgi:NADH-quinone oxidoreductase subunit A
VGARIRALCAFEEHAHNGTKRLCARCYSGISRSPMPTTYAETWFPVLVQILIAMAVAGGMIGASALLGRRLRDPVKFSPYESGMKPVGSARERFSVKFYLVAMVFIVFDIEAIFLYPWAVVYRELRLFAFFEMLLFIVLVLAGFFYIWKKGVLDWSAEKRKTDAQETKHAA